MLLSSKRDALLSQRTGYFWRYHDLFTAEDYLDPANEPEETAWDFGHLWSRYFVSSPSTFLFFFFFFFFSLIIKWLIVSRASIAACIRLAHTVAFASQPDSIYLIGPLLFWADAEMTCGFFIFSVPCLSKLIMESGIWQRVLSALGFSNTFSSRSNQSSDCTPRARSLRHIPKDWMPTIDSTWSRIDEEHIGLHNRSGSRTNLYGISESHAGKDEVRVQRALDVTVSSDGHPKNRNWDKNAPWK